MHYNTENMETYGPTLSFKNRKALLMAIAPSAPPKNLEPVSPWLPPLPEKSRAFLFPFPWLGSMEAEGIL